MTSSELISEAIMEVTKGMNRYVRESTTPEQQELAVDMITALRSLGRLTKDMGFKEARQLVLDLEDPERQQIIDVLASKGIFI